MKLLPGYFFALSLMMSNSIWAQVDIYQSPAYSVEEMCAREAQQNQSTDYSEAYESCLEKNRDNPLYQPNPPGTDRHGSSAKTEDSNSGQNKDNN